VVFSESQWLPLTLHSAIAVTGTDVDAYWRKHLIIYLAFWIKLEKIFDAGMNFTYTVFFWKKSSVKFKQYSQWRPENNIVTEVVVFYFS
jgi:hypothetical protein